MLLFELLISFARYLGFCNFLAMYTLCNLIFVNQTLNSLYYFSGKRLSACHQEFPWSIGENLLQGNFFSKAIGFFSRILTQFAGKQVKEGVLSTISTFSLTIRHFFTAVCLRCVSPVFNSSACNCHTVTRWDFSTSELAFDLTGNYILIADVIMHFVQTLVLNLHLLSP